MSENKIENPPVYPQLVYEERVAGIGTFTDPDAPGMALRDYFAAKAMQAILSTRTVARLEKDGNNYSARAASAAYHIADAMLAERSRKP